MGLRVQDFNLNELKGKDILQMRIDAANESTITVADKDGNKLRRRLPIQLVRMLEWYCSAETVS
jgi:hypothetical protein